MTKKQVQRRGVLKARPAGSFFWSGPYERRPSRPKPMTERELHSPSVTCDRLKTVCEKRWHIDGRRWESSGEGERRRVYAAWIRKIGLMTNPKKINESSAELVLFVMAEPRINHIINKLTAEMTMSFPKLRKREKLFDEKTSIVSRILSALGSARFYRESAARASKLVRPARPPSSREDIDGIDSNALNHGELCLMISMGYDVRPRRNDPDSLDHDTHSAIADADGGETLEERKDREEGEETAEREAEAFVDGVDDDGVQPAGSKARRPSKIDTSEDQEPVGVTEEEQ